MHGSTWMRVVGWAVGVMAFTLLVPGDGLRASADEPPAAGKKKPDVGYYPTTQDIVERMLELARVAPRDTLVDLGCGDGRFVITAARKYGCRATGYEIDPKLIEQGRKQIREEKLEALARIEDRDLFTVDLSDTSVVMLFLLPKMNEKLVPQFRKMRPGSRIIAHEFEIPGLKPDRELVLVSTVDKSEHVIFVYSHPFPAADAKSAPDR